MVWHPLNICIDLYYLERGLRAVSAEGKGM